MTPEWRSSKSCSPSEKVLHESLDWGIVCPDTIGQVLPEPLRPPLPDKKPAVRLLIQPETKTSSFKFSIQFPKFRRDLDKILPRRKLNLTS